MCRVSGGWPACVQWLTDWSSATRPSFRWSSASSRATGPGSAPSIGRDSCSIAVHAAADEAWDYLIDDFTPISARARAPPTGASLHRLGAVDLAPLYPRWADFAAVRQRFDPQGRLLNAHLRQVFGIT